MDESEKSADPEAVTGDEPSRPPQGAWAVASTVSLDLGKRFGQLIGRYKVVRVLGERVKAAWKALPAASG